MTLPLIVIGLWASLLVGIIALHHMAQPKWRIRHGQVMSSLYDVRGATFSSLRPDVKCAACGRPGINTLVRNRWQADMPVCQGCLAEHNPEPIAREVAPGFVVYEGKRPPLRRVPLDAPLPAGKPEPRF